VRYITLSGSHPSIHLYDNVCVYRTVEIILPSEHVGTVREEYEWKVSVIHDVHSVLSYVMN
jgi:hypothetical protein